MGSAPSAALPKVIHLELDGRIQKVIFSRLSSLSDVRDLLCAAAGLLRGGTLSLFDHKGSPVTIDPEMPANPKSSPYKVVVTSSGPSGKQFLNVKFFPVSGPHWPRPAFCPSLYPCRFSGRSPGSDICTHGQDSSRTPLLPPEV
ncbi:high affinity cGMP-specific 3',5'-cyclic phosphodiesterase 9A-like isoform X2 [Hemitrygon akajei]|uniref:high affinity cGMP-specific 3',5'-cyclic phosphodiesterase 9A-like isoform X2 n=1 Tax=Hemitrygon akajei TaxID=2704970 RepID=UPI003BF97F2E